MNPAVTADDQALLGQVGEVAPDGGGAGVEGLLGLLDAEEGFLLKHFEDHTPTFECMHGVGSPDSDLIQSRSVIANGFSIHDRGQSKSCRPCS